MVLNGRLAERTGVVYVPSLYSGVDRKNVGLTVSVSAKCRSTSFWESGGMFHLKIFELSYISD